MVDIQYGNLLMDIGIGAFLGFIAGYVAKIFLKIFLALAAIYVASLFYLQQRGIITINANKIGNISSIDFQLSGITGLLGNLVGILPIGGSFIAGAYLGFKKT